MDKMDQFPELFELISFFESEPVLAKAGESLTFLAVRDRDRIECEIGRADSTLKLRWSQGERELVNLDLDIVTGLRIENREGKEIMRGTLISPTPEIGRLLIVQLKPSIHIRLEIK